MSLKGDKKEEKVYIYRVCYILFPTYHSWFPSFIRSCGFKLPSGVISIFQYNFALTPLLSCYCQIYYYISVCYGPNNTIVYILSYTNAF